jgi:hypothetical protein
MPVDNMGSFDVQPKFIQNAVYNILPIQHGIIAVFRLLMGLLILHKITLKGGHLVPAVNRGIRTGPGIPDVILSPAHSCRIILGIISLSGIIVQHIIERSALVGLAVYVHGLEIPFLIQRDTAMVKKVGIMDFVESAVGIKEAYMLLQLFAF